MHLVLISQSPPISDGSSLVFLWCLWSVLVMYFVEYLSVQVCLMFSCGYWGYAFLARIHIMMLCSSHHIWGYRILMCLITDDVKVVCAVFLHWNLLFPPWLLINILEKIVWNYVSILFPFTLLLLAFIYVFFGAFWKIFNKVPWEINSKKKKKKRKSGWFNYYRCFSAAPKVFINTVIWRGGPGPGPDYSWEQ